MITAAKLRNEEKGKLFNFHVENGKFGAGKRIYGTKGVFLLTCPVFIMAEK